MKHTLPDLPYEYDALEPHIDETTMRIHHTKHHQAYIDKLNAALEKHPALQDKTVDELLADLSSIPEDIRTAVRNHGGGHANHTFFWRVMAPKAGGKPGGALAAAINKDFVSFAQFQEAFTARALSLFGSGWTWLVFDGVKLEILNTPNQDNPRSEGKAPILGVDMWEHAMYLRFQNRKNEYLAAWWNVVNWPYVEKLFEA